jgi:lysyl-tRNA synthetase class II
MAKITIKLAPSKTMSDFYMSDDKMSLAKSHYDNYTVMESFHVYKSGEAAANEAFDLTNNPARQEERVERYGRFRSVSVGDIVNVDGVEYLCDSFGWSQI